MKDIRLPRPSVYHLIVVGGDVLSGLKDAWERSFVIMRNRIKPAGPGGMVLTGPKPGTPDALAAKAARDLGMIHAKLCFDGKVTAIAPPGADTMSASGYEDKLFDTWTSHKPCDEVAMDHLAMQAHLAMMSGWKVRAIIMHGWDGSFRGELLSERMKHLGVPTDEMDIATNGAYLERK